LVKTDNVPRAKAQPVCQQALTGFATRHPPVQCLAGPHRPLTGSPFHEHLSGQWNPAGMPSIIA